MSVNAAELLIRISGSSRGLDKELKGTAAKLSRLGSRFKAIGMGLTMAVSLPLAAIGGLSVKAAGDFEQAITSATAISEDFRNSQDELGRVAREVAKDLGFSARETGEAYFFLASANLNAEQSIASLPTVAAFARAGMFDLAQSTDLLTDAQSALGLSSDDAAQHLENMQRVADVLVGANTKANASVQQFAEALTTDAAAAARAVGMEVEEVVATLAVFADQGLKGTQAGTKFRIALAELKKNALENADAFKQLGIEVFDANTGALKPMADIVRDLEDALLPMSAAAQQAALSNLGFGVKTVGVIQTLLGYSDRLRQINEELHNVAGITEDVARRQLDTLNGAFKKLRSQAGDLAIELGGALAPTIRKVAEFLTEFLKTTTDVVKKVTEFLEPVMDIVVGFGMFAIALGPVLWAVGGLIKLVGLLTTAFSFLAAHPLVLAAAGVVALVKVIMRYSDAARDARDDTNKMASELEEATSALEKATAAREKAVEALRQEQALLKHNRYRQAIETIEELQDKIEELNMQRQEGIEIGQHILDALRDEIRAQEEIAAKYKESAITMQEAAIADAKAAVEIAKKTEAQAGEAAILARLSDRLEKAYHAYERHRDMTKKIREESEAYKTALEDLNGAHLEESETAGKVQEIFDQLSASLEELVGKQEAATEAARALTDYEEAIQRLNLETQLFGESQDTMAERLALIRDRMLEVAESEGVESEALAALREEYAALDEQLNGTKAIIDNWAESIKPKFAEILRDTLNLITSVVDGFSRGVGNSIARTLVYGESFSKGFTKMMKQVAANFIASLIEMGIKLIAFGILYAIFRKKMLGGSVATAVGRSYSGAAASVYEAVPFPLNMVLAPIMAMQAAGVAAFGAILGAVPLAEGGLTKAEGLAYLHPDEIVSPIDKIERMFGPREIIIHHVTELDGEVVAESVARHLPGAITGAIGSMA